MPALKGFFAAIIFVLLTIALFGQTDTVSTGTGGSGGVFSWIWSNIWILLLSIVGVLEIIFRLTPSESDNSILNKIKGWLDAIIPNNKKGGETF